MRRPMIRRTFVLLLFLAAPAAAQPESTRTRLVEAAYAQIGVTLGYDASYPQIAFPGGDVPRDRGCAATSSSAPVAAPESIYSGW
jgi:uncharacterized protein